MRRQLAPVLVGVVLVLVGCGDDEPPSIEEIAEQVGCENPTPQDTDELYVVDAVECADGGRVLTFNTNSARDSFIEIAEEFGGTYETGDGYAVEAP